MVGCATNITTNITTVEEIAEEPSVESSGKVALPGKGVPIVYEGVLKRKVGLHADGGGSGGHPKRLRIELAVQVDDESDE